MTPSQYERVFAEIVDAIVSKSRTLEVNYESKNRVLVASGYSRQIDVSITSQTKITIVECKRWKTKIGLSTVMVPFARACDVQENNPGKIVIPIVASTKQPTRGAIKYAKHVGINHEQVTSTTEFGFRIGKIASHGLTSGFRASVVAEAEVRHRK